VVDLLFGGVVGHVHNHGDDPSFPLPPKTKAAILIAALAESLSCSLLSWRLAPIQHLRRKRKPIAAKQAKHAKSRHIDDKL
jgi:hypothetical protein